MCLSGQAREGVEKRKCSSEVTMSSRFRKKDATFVSVYITKSIAERKS